MTGVTYMECYRWNVLVPPVNGSSVTIIWGPGGGTVECVSRHSRQVLVVFHLLLLHSLSKPVPAFTLPVITAGAPIVCLEGNNNVFDSFATHQQWNLYLVCCSRYCQNIMTANGTNQISIKWVDNSNPNILWNWKSVGVTKIQWYLPVIYWVCPGTEYQLFALWSMYFRSISFTTSSTGPIWHWNFGTMILQFSNPVHPYLNSGGILPFNCILQMLRDVLIRHTLKFMWQHSDRSCDNRQFKCLSRCFANYTFSEPLFNGASYTWSLTAPVKGNVVSSSSTNMYIEWTSPGTDTIKLRCNLHVWIQQYILL